MKNLFLKHALLALLIITQVHCSKNNHPTMPEMPPEVTEIPEDTSDMVPSVNNTIEIDSYLALGDSYTIGQSVAEAARYPNQLADSLATVDVHIGRVKIIAQTGWTTQNLQSAMDAQLTADSTYNLVSLLIGVNNQYQGKPLDAYEVEFTSLLQQAVQLAGGQSDRVFVISIPDYAYTPFGNGNTTISEELDQFNAANQAITAAMGIQYFNITPISRNGFTDPELVATDGLHPSGKQYAQWVELMFSEVKTMLE